MAANEKVKLLDKEFEIFITSEKIDCAVAEVAQKMNENLKNEDVIFIGVLNGSFLFAADLYRKLEFDSQISFVKVASYMGTSSTGNVKRLIGLNEDVRNKTVIILEDIIDSGKTIEDLVKQIKGYEPKSIQIASFLFKPDAYLGTLPIDYVGIEIPNDFIVGYGLDYNGLGRNLPHIYKIVE
jgi:hypoxanthine phosphoribosyltransferase